MKSGASSLNPYAASYVPLSKRGVAVNKEFNPTQVVNSGSGNEFVQYGHQPVNTFPQGQHKNVSQSSAHSDRPAPTAELSKWKDHHGSEYVTSTSQYRNEMPEKLHFDEVDMDLAYLQMTFPGLSDESLSDVYLANRCDLDATIDMINQLEVHPDDSSDRLPDTLDIGDVPDSEEAKKMKGEAGASTSNCTTPSKS